MRKFIYIYPIATEKDRFITETVVKKIRNSSLDITTGEFKMRKVEKMSQLTLITVRNMFQHLFSK